MIRELTDAEFHTTMREPIRKLAEDEVYRPIPLDEYVAACIAKHDLPATVETIELAYIFLIADGAFSHVLLFFGMANVYLIIVIDHGTDSVFGYHFLDLNEKYGLDQPLVC